MQRIRELVALTKAAYPRDKFFSNLDQTLRTIPEARKQYRTYERALSTLDSDSWSALCGKAVKHFRDHRKGQLKQGFFNQLHDAFAYQHLVRNGFRDVRVLQESDKTQPDIQYVDGDEKKHCEVKTIGISDALIARREGMQGTSSTIYQVLPPEFLNKLRSTINVANEQIKAQGTRGLIFLLIFFDDFLLEHYTTYRYQVAKCFEAHAAENIYAKVAILGRRRITKGRVSAVGYGA